MTTSNTKPTHSHGITELCDAGARLYASALRLGRIARAEVEPAPCLMEFALLHPDPDDPDWLRPVPPTIALAQHLHPIEREILERRRRLGRTDGVVRAIHGHQHSGAAQHPRHHRAGRREPDQRGPRSRHRRVPHRSAHRPARRRPDRGSSQQVAGTRPVRDPPRRQHAHPLPAHRAPQPQHARVRGTHDRRQRGDTHARRADRPPDRVRPDRRLHPGQRRRPSGPGTPPSRARAVPGQRVRAVLDEGCSAAGGGQVRTDLPGHQRGSALHRPAPRGGPCGRLDRPCGSA